LDPFATEKRRAVLTGAVVAYWYRHQGAQACGRAVNGRDGCPRLVWWLFVGVPELVVPAPGAHRERRRSAEVHPGAGINSLLLLLQHAQKYQSVSPLFEELLHQLSIGHVALSRSITSSPISTDLYPCQLPPSTHRYTTPFSTPMFLIPSKYPHLHGALHSCPWCMFVTSATATFTRYFI
jgi:hypothetical protein